FSPVAMIAPNRFPPPPVRCATAAVAAATRSRFSHAAGPKNRLPDRAPPSPGSSSRAAPPSPRCGTRGRAGTPQPPRRPPGAGLAGLGAGPRHEAEMVALQQTVEATAYIELEQAQAVLHSLALQDRRRPGRAVAGLALVLHDLPATPTGGGATPPDWGRAETC